MYSLAIVIYSIYFFILFYIIKCDISSSYILCKWSYWYTYIYTYVAVKHRCLQRFYIENIDLFLCNIDGSVTVVAILHSL